MAKTQYASPVLAEDYANQGSLYAFTFVDVTDIFGQTRTRRVSLGRIHSVGLNTAKDMVKQARESNKAAPINASFTMFL